jgi:hypothetical protein
VGTDNLFHKNRAKSAQKLARRQAKREPYDRVLIVCEGQKTEPNYFSEMKDYYCLSSANVEVTGDCDSSPVDVFNFAKNKYQLSKQEGNEFDRVYCVFDKDAHSTYYDTLNAIKAFKPHDKIHAITSVPCFEFWLLLHFNYSTSPFNHLPGNSAGNQVFRELKRFMPDYEKGACGIFKELFPSLAQAKIWAQRITDGNTQIGTDNPSTGIHMLVDYLQRIRD